MAWVRAASAVLAIADLNDLADDAGFKQHVLAPLKSAAERAMRRGQTGKVEPSPDGPSPAGPASPGPSPVPVPPRPAGR